MFFMILGILYSDPGDDVISEVLNGTALSFNATMNSTLTF